MCDRAFLIPGTGLGVGASDGYGRREEAKEIEGNFATMLNISQSERKPRKKGQEPGIQGTGDLRFGPPTPPPSPVYKPKAA